MFLGGFMVFNATFNNISVKSSVLLVKETGVPGENDGQVTDELALYRVPLTMNRYQTHKVRDA